MTKRKSVFLGAWSSMDEMIRDWEIPADDLKGYRIIVAIYDLGAYDGSAFVLAKRGRTYYESSASHCSCYGLEWGGWEETTTAALSMRNFFGCDEVRSHVLREIGIKNA